LTINSYVNGVTLLIGVYLFFRQQRNRWKGLGMPRMPTKSAKWSIPMILLD